MARGNGKQTFALTQFTGLNTLADEENVRPSDLATLHNAKLTRDLKLKRRDGHELAYSGGTGKINGIMEYEDPSGVAWKLKVEGKRLYKWVSNAWVAVHEVDLDIDEARPVESHIRNGFLYFGNRTIYTLGPKEEAVIMTGLSQTGITYYSLADGSSTTKTWEGIGIVLPDFSGYPYGWSVKDYLYDPVTGQHALIVSITTSDWGEFMGATIRFLIYSKGSLIFDYSINRGKVIKFKLFVGQSDAYFYFAEASSYYKIGVRLYAYNKASGEFTKKASTGLSFEYEGGGSGMKESRFISFFTVAGVLFYTVTYYKVQEQYYVSVLVRNEVINGEIVITELKSSPIAERQDAYIYFPVIEYSNTDYAYLYDYLYIKKEIRNEVRTYKWTDGTVTEYIEDETPLHEFSYNPPRNNDITKFRFFGVKDGYLYWIKPNQATAEKFAGRDIPVGSGITPKLMSFSPPDIEIINISNVSLVGSASTSGLQARVFRDDTTDTGLISLFRDDGQGVNSFTPSTTGLFINKFTYTYCNRYFYFSESEGPITGRLPKLPVGVNLNSVLFPVIGYDPYLDSLNKIKDSLITGQRFCEHQGLIVFVEEGNNQSGKGFQTIKWTAPASDLPGVYDFTYGSNRITGLCSAGGRIYVFYRDRIQAMDGVLTENYSVSTVSERYGCVSHNSIRAMKDSVFFLGEQGFFLMYGNIVQLISEPIQSYINSINRAVIDKAYAVLDLSQDEYRCWVPTGASQTLNLCLVYNFMTKTWHTEDIGVLSPTALAYVNDADGFGEQLIGFSDGRIFRANRGDSDAGTEISCDVMSGQLQFGDPFTEQTVKTMIVNGKKNSEVLLSYRTDRGEWLPAALGQNGSAYKVNNVVRVFNGKGLLFQWRIHGRDIRPAWQVDGVLFEYYPTQQRGIQHGT